MKDEDLLSAIQIGIKPSLRQFVMFTKLRGKQVASHKNAPIEELHKPKYNVFHHKMVVLFKDLGLLNPGENPAGAINNIADLVNHLCNSYCRSGNDDSYSSSR